MANPITFEDYFPTSDKTYPFIPHAHGYDRIDFKTAVNFTNSALGTFNVTDVRNFGAKGDGVTDDAAAIQAAINAVPASGGILYLPRGVYVVGTPLVITNFNIHVWGDGWSNPHAKETNPVTPSVSLSVLQPSASFPANSFVITFNNTAIMILGCSFQNIAIDGQVAHSVSNVGGLHLGNAAFFIFRGVQMNDLTGSNVLIDQAGATYPNPSTSQIWMSDFNLYQGGRDGIEIGNVFMTELYITEFFIQNFNSRYGISLVQGTGTYACHIANGTIDNCQTGLLWNGHGSLIHDLTLSQCWNNGFYMKQTDTNGFITIVHDIICRDNDMNVNGSSQFMIDTGSHDVRVHDVVCEKVARTPEIGFQVVDGFGTNGVFVDQSCFASNHSTANFKSGSTNYSFTRLGANTNGTATVTTPSFTSGTAQQLNLIQDVMLYIDVTTAASLTIAIGPTSSTTTTLQNAITGGLGLESIRVPAGWWVNLTGTMADLTITAITC